MSRPPLPIALGVDIGGTKVKVCAADLDGRILATATRSSGSGRPEPEVLADLAHCLGSATGSAAALLDRPVQTAAAGLATPGVVTGEGVGLVPNNPGMESSIPARVLAAMLGVEEVAWANDVKAAAMAEHQWGQLQGTSCGLYVNLGTGLSAGAVIEGRPLMGAHGAALEIGYLLPAAPGRPPGHRSGAAPLEDLISGRALARRAAQLGAPGLDASEIIALAGSRGSEDSALVGLAEDFVEELVHAVVNLAVVLDPERISVGGGVATDTAAAVFLPPLRAALGEYAPYPPEVLVSPAANDLSVLGALLLAYRRLGCGIPTVAVPLASAVPALPRPDAGAVLASAVPTSEGA